MIAKRECEAVGGEIVVFRVGSAFQLSRFIETLFQSNKMCGAVGVPKKIGGRGCNFGSGRLDMTLPRVSIHIS